MLCCLHAELWLPCLQRIMGVKYSWPSNLHLTRECVDMMNKIFVSNPAQRINIAGIQAHPWFTKNLPDELKVWHTGDLHELWGLFGDVTERALVYIACCQRKGASGPAQAACFVLASALASTT